MCFIVGGIKILEINCKGNLNKLKESDEGIILEFEDEEVDVLSEFGDFLLEGFERNDDFEPIDDDDPDPDDNNFGREDDDLEPVNVSNLGPDENDFGREDDDFEPTDDIDIGPSDNDFVREEGDFGFMTDNEPDLEPDESDFEAGDGFDVNGIAFETCRDGNCCRSG